MFCAEEQLLLVALPQHVGIFGSKHVKAAPGKNFCQNYGNVFVQIELRKMVHLPWIEGWTS